MRDTIKLLPLLLAFAALPFACSSETAQGDDDDGGQQRSIACGNETCTGNETCCPGPGSCTLDGSDCVSPDNGHGFWMDCDGPEDCASGEVCCIWVAATAMGATECMAIGDCDYSIFGTQYACHGGGDCPADMTCQPADVADAFVPTLLGCK